MLKPSFKFQVVTESRIDIKERRRFIIVFIIFSKSKEFVFNAQTLLEIFQVLIKPCSGIEKHKRVTLSIQFQSPHSKSK